MSEPTIVLMAGEASGDLHGAALAKALRVRWPSAHMLGTGGARMEAEGVALLAELDDLAVMGFSEIVPRIPYFLRLERRVIKALDKSEADLVVLIDYPGFNMRIARAAHDRGHRVLYYVAPQVWAWRTGRADKLAQTTDRVAVILPFEADFLREYGVNATYVGHPLLDRPDDVTPRDEFFDTWGLDPSRPLLAVLPGSRKQELDRHLAPFTKTARLVSANAPHVLPVFARAATIDARRFHDTGFPVVEDTRALLRYADAALVKSGTSTLEATLENTPHVIAYAMSGLSALIARRVLRTEFVGLPNLVAGELVVPEFLQEGMDPVTMSLTLTELLRDGSPQRTQQLDRLKRVRGRLGEPGAAARVAQLAFELVEGEGA